MNKTEYMEKAFKLAEKAIQEGEIPVGAIVVEDGRIIGEGCNRQREDSDPTAHAEVVALRAAAKVKNNFRLDGADMYVTIEPCNMCREAISRARIGTVHYASYKANPSTHKTEYVAVDDFSSESCDILKKFFKCRR
ncbi:MAG: nucleoside deaminase [Elusimicrobiota bacterium]